MQQFKDAVVFSVVLCWSPEIVLFYPPVVVVFLLLLLHVICIVVN